MSYYYEEPSPYEEGFADGYDGWDTENPFYYGTWAYWDYEDGHLDGMHSYYARLFRWYGY